MTTSPTVLLNSFNYLTHGIKLTRRNFSVSSVKNMRLVQFKQKSSGQRQLGAQISADGDIFQLSAIDSSIPNSLVKFLAGGPTLYEKAKSVKMRFVQYKLKHGGPIQLGAQVVQDGDVYHLSAIDGAIPKNLIKFLELGEEMYEEAKRVVGAGKSLVPLSDVDLLSPILNPNKVACVGLNYTGHCDEQNLPYPKEPMIFSKWASSIVGPNDNIVLPSISNSVDWEVELAVIIGKQAKNIRPDQVNDYIFGYTIAQDISARDWQKKRNNGQFLLGKTMDTFCPLGPVVVTKNKIDPNNLKIKSWVNGKLKQDGNTSELIFKIDFLVSYLSQIVTLYPGDVLLTGTPAGVGCHRNPPEFLKKGDVLESEIEGIGRLRNVVV